MNTHQVASRIEQYIEDLVSKYIVLAVCKRGVGIQTTLSELTPEDCEVLTTSFAIIRSNTKYAIDSCVDCYEMGSSAIFNDNVPHVVFVEEDGEMFLYRNDIKANKDVGKTTIENIAAYCYTLNTKALNLCIESATKHGLTDEDLDTGLCEFSL